MKQFERQKILDLYDRGDPVSTLHLTVGFTRESIECVVYYRDLPAKIFEELRDGDTNGFAVAYASYKSGRNKDDVKRLLRDFTVSEIIKGVEMCVDRGNAHNH